MVYLRVSDLKVEAHPADCAHEQLKLPWRVLTPTRSALKSARCSGKLRTTQRSCADHLLKPESAVSLRAGSPTAIIRIVDAGASRRYDHRRSQLKGSFMRTRHLILRAPSRLLSRSRGTEVLAQPFEVQTPWEVSVAVESLEREELRSVTNDPDVLAFAPIMPMRLIEPLQTGPVDDGEEGDSTWGVRAVKAHTSPYTGKGVVVAVLDTGIDASHPTFAGLDVVTRNFTNGPDEDIHGHGTHCAATIFGRNVGGTRIGVALGVEKALIAKVLGPDGGSSETLVNAINWAVENKATVVSMSLGIDFPGFAQRLREQDPTLPEALVVSRALEGYRANVVLFERLAMALQVRPAPTLIVAAAGNESRRDQDPRHEIGVSPPAVSNGFISVAALGRSAAGLTVAGFSNTGANISGPGVGVISAALGGGLKKANGTSSAAPHVAGAAVLWAERLHRERSLTWLNLTARLIGSATLDGLHDGIDPFDIGAGLVTAPQN